MTETIRAITQANRASWNKIAAERHGDPPVFYQAGGVSLADFERELAGDVEGKRVLTLACSSGDQVLSWANLGATAIGIDISDVAVEKAKRKADQAQIEAEFRQADMFDLPEDLDDLDLIYFSWGGICWAPDLNAFTQAITARLKHGGAVLMSDHHPIWEVLAVRGTNQLAVIGDYFGQGTPRVDTDDAKRPIGARSKADAPNFSAFVWPISDVVMAFVKSGLRLDAFFEAPEPDIYAGLGDPAARLPAYYVISATKP